MTWPQKQGIVLVPFDFSEPANHAIEVAKTFVTENAHLAVLHVLPPLAPLDPGVVWNTLDEERARKSAASSLDTTLDDLKCSPCHREVVIGDPASSILERARELNAELIVIPTHGRTGLRRFMLGSVAERIVRFAHCPVLVLRRKSDEKDEGSTKK